MSSENENTPSNINNEKSDPTNETEAAAPETVVATTTTETETTAETAAETAPAAATLEIATTTTTATGTPAPSNAPLDVHALKERIIATNKLFKYLQDAKKELSTREAQITTLNTNLSVSIKSLQESDAKYKKSTDQIKTLETEIKAKSSQLDILTDSNKHLKNDLRKQAELSKRMGSSAAEFRIAKEQVAKLTEENKQLKESVSKLQAEKEQLDDDAMETSINHNLIVESLREEITDLKSSLTTEDSSLVSLRLQLSMEQNKISTANEKIKSLEQALQQSNASKTNTLNKSLENALQQSKATKANEQIKTLEQALQQSRSKANEQMKSLEQALLQSIDKNKHTEDQLLKERNRAPPPPIVAPVAPAPVYNVELENIKRMHGEQVANFKRELAIMSAKLQKQKSQPLEADQTPPPPPLTNPEVLRKYHELKGKYQLLKKTNGFLNQELQNVLANASKTKGITSDSDSDDMSVDLDDDTFAPMSIDVEPFTPAAAPAAAAPKPALKQSLPRDPRLAQQMLQQQAEEESRLQQQQKSGLIIPPPRTNTLKQPKKRTSLLVKFANSKNPSKVLERAKAPASTSSASSLPKKRSHSNMEVEDLTAPTATATATAAETVSKVLSPAAAAPPNTSADTAAAPHAAKKAKQDYHWNHVIEELFNRDHGKTLPTLDDYNRILPHLLDELEECYGRIKSVAVPVDPTLVPFGASELLLPKSLDQREKIYAWFLVSLLKVQKQEYNQFMLKLAGATKHCPTSKTPLNNKLIRFIRLFAVACKAENSLGRLRTLIYALFRTTAFHASLVSCILNTAILWKESFVFETTNPHFQALHNTFISSVYLISCRAGTAKNIKSMYERLASIFSWPLEPKPVLDCVQDTMITLQSNYFKELHTSDKDKFDLLSFNLITSFELAFIVLDDWKQTYDVFIRTQLWPVLSMEVIDVVAMELLGVLARLGISDDPLKADKPGVVTLLETFSGIVDLGKDIDPSEKHLQFAATKSMAAVAGNHYQYKKFLINLQDI